MITLGNTYEFRPRTKDFMHLPKLAEACLETGRVEDGDTCGSIKLWPAERLRVRHILQTAKDGTPEFVIATMATIIVLVPCADLNPEPVLL